MIVFKKIRYKNFLSAGNIWTEVVLDKTNTTLIVGSNGSGKSSTIDALSYCLFGRAFRKINKPQLINSITNKHLEVQVEFVLGQTEYMIVRGMKPSKFEIYQDGTLINQDAANKDYQDIVERQILKINHKSFCQVVILGSSNYVPFMQLTSMARREIIEDLLDLQVFTMMNSVLKQKIESTDNDFWEVEENINRLTDRIKFINEHLKSVQIDVKKTIDNKKQKIVLLQSKQTELDQEIIDLQQSVIKTDQDIINLGNQREKIRSLEKYEFQINSRIDNSNKMIDFLTDQDQCPTCKQHIDQDFKDKTIETKQKFIATLQEGKQLVLCKKAVVKDKLKQIDDLCKHANTQRLKLSQVITEHKHLKNSIANLNTEIDALKTKHTTTTNEKVEKYQTQLEQEKVKYNDLQEQRNINDVLQYVLKDGGIKSKIIKQYVPIINKLINKYLSMMDFFVDFSLDENFNETIKSRNRDTFSYESFSEGEKMRLNLAILFAWRSLATMRNSINTNLIIFDEILDSSLDQNGTEEFLKIIMQLTKETNTFVISHHVDMLYDKFDRVLTFTKTKNFSQMKEE